MYRKLFLMSLVGCVISMFLIPRVCAAGKHHHGHARAERKGMHDHGAGAESHATEQAAEGLGTCPVMGGAANKDNSYTHEGKTYYFCCPWCIEEFKKNPQAYISDKQ